ncbi:mCG147830, partial [Mus musculus]
MRVTNQVPMICHSSGGTDDWTFLSASKTQGYQLLLLKGGRDRQGLEKREDLLRIRVGKNYKTTFYSS